jgi:hypothetical protein
VAARRISRAIAQAAEISLSSAAGLARAWPATAPISTFKLSEVAEFAARLGEIAGLFMIPGAQPGAVRRRE